MVYIILGEGFEPIEAVAPCDILRRGGVEVQLAGIGGRKIAGAHGITVEADCTVEEMDAERTEMIVLPGGMGGVHSILGCKTALDAVRNAYAAGKYVAAICAGPTVLAKLGLLKGKKATCYPGCEDRMEGADCTGAKTEQDGKIITGQAPGRSLDFGLRLLEALRGTQTAENVKNGLVY